MSLSSMKRKALWLLPVAYTLVLLPFLLLPWLDPVGSDFRRIKIGMERREAQAILGKRMYWVG